MATTLPHAYTQLFLRLQLCVAALPFLYFRYTNALRLGRAPPPRCLYRSQPIVTKHGAGSSPLGGTYRTEVASPPKLEQPCETCKISPQTGIALRTLEKAPSPQECPCERLQRHPSNWISLAQVCNRSPLTGLALRTLAKVPSKLGSAFASLRKQAPTWRAVNARWALGKGCELI